MPQNGVQAFTAPGTLAINIAGIPISTVVAQATGSGTGLTFAAQGLPSPNGTLVTLPMYPLAAGVVGEPVVSASANGTWIIPCAGFIGVTLDLIAIGGGTESFSLSSSAGLWPFA